MLKKILVALDLLDSNEIVFQNALELATATGANLMFLHSLTGDQDGGPSMPVSGAWDYYAVAGEGAWARYQADWQTYTEQSLSMLRRYTERATAAGLSAEFTQVERQPARAICDLAHSWNADVIVVGSHGRKGISELVIGSVSNYVMHHAHCSVLIVRLDKSATTAEPTAESAAA
ncbi:MAG: universal stress protein [Cyanobacteria bacterium J06614_10]